MCYWAGYACEWLKFNASGDHMKNCAEFISKLSTLLTEAGVVIYQHLQALQRSHWYNVAQGLTWTKTSIHHKSHNVSINCLAWPKVESIHGYSNWAGYFKGSNVISQDPAKLVFSLECVLTPQVCWVNPSLHNLFGKNVVIRPYPPATKDGNAVFGLGSHLFT